MTFLIAVGCKTLSKLKRGCQKLALVTSLRARNVRRIFEDGTGVPSTRARYYLQGVHDIVLRYCSTAVRVNTPERADLILAATTTVRRCDDDDLRDTGLLFLAVFFLIGVPVLKAAAFPGWPRKARSGRAHRPRRRRRRPLRSTSRAKTRRACTRSTRNRTRSHTRRRSSRYVSCGPPHTKPSSSTGHAAVRADAAPRAIAVRVVG